MEFIHEDFVADTQIYTDDTRLKQILFILINNSIKYTEKGFIRIIFEKRVLQSVNCLEEKIELLFVTVKDTGIGINELVQEKLLKNEFVENTKLTSHRSGLKLGI